KEFAADLAKPIIGGARSRYDSPQHEENAEHAADDAEHSEEHEEHAEDQVRLYPSEYLRRRCPLCYGGKDWRMVCGTNYSVDAIGCIDACFNQKHTHAHENDPKNSTESFFIPEREVQQMEAEQGPTIDTEDGYEEGMHIPTSVLEGCNESFIAADEKREKASTQFFSDTGVMALLCRHDRVLWLVNMTSAGEKQHYALALIRQWFKHLPSDFKVGLLYDIGCQLEQSCCKWGFLTDVLPRIIFDEQVRHLNNKSILAFSHWLWRRWGHCQEKKAVAKEGLKMCNIAVEALRQEWKVQVTMQTKPALKQSKNKGAEAIAAILTLENILEQHCSMVHELENSLLSGTTNIINVNLQLLEYWGKCKHIADNIQKYELSMHHEPGIVKLLKTYNDLCTQLQALIHQGKAPRNALPPLPIAREGLFQLDIDDEVWQDIGLDDPNNLPPGWLANDGVWQGIKYMLDLDRCEEEAACVMRERCTLQEWMEEEWMRVECVKEQFNRDEDMLFVLDQHATMLAEMCVTWQEKVHGIPCLWPMPQEWGPLPEKLTAAASHHHDSVANGSLALVVDDEDYEDLSDGDDGELLDTIEDIALIDEYHGESIGDKLSGINFEYELCDLDPLSSLVRPSTNKRFCET
ncbi:hypothetical protein AZE42_11907, partial [Rhizopogon vesiculosus]